MNLFSQLVIEGIEQGAIYAIWALGYALVYQVLGLLNFAFGDVLLLCLYVIVGLTASGVPVGLAIMAALALAALASMFIERQVYARFISKGQAEAGFIAAIGCAYIARNVATLLEGVQPLTFPTVFSSHTYDVSGSKISSGGLIVLAVSVITMLLLAAFLRWTKVGRGIVLLGQDRASAAIIGIPVRRTVTLVYGVSGALGLVGAVLFANLSKGVDTSTGFYITFQAFIAATVGGAGSLMGSVIGGLALGLASSLAVGYVSGDFAEALAWAAMAGIVLLRPRGLLGRSAVERV